MKLLKSLLFVLGFVATVSAGSIVIFDEATNQVKQIKHSVNTPSYSGRTDVLFNPVIPSTPTKFMIQDSGSLRAMTETEMNSILLDSEKALKKAEVDLEVQSLIESGFEFNGSTFSLSNEAKINWTNLAIAKGLLTYPVSVTTLSGGNYDLNKSTNIDSFYGTAIGTVKAYYDYGISQKALIDACTYYYCVRPQ